MKPSLYILFLTLLVSCGDQLYVRFEKAQPEGVKSLESFSRKVKGNFINCSNPLDLITISDNLIVNSRTFKFKSHRADLDLDSTINIDSNNDKELIKLFTSEGYQIEIIGDTISASLTSLDTIFIISENQVLKKFKGSYFLSSKWDENSWNVSQISFLKDTLLMGQISPSDTLLRFDFIAKTEDYNTTDSTTSTQYSINPSKRQFKKLIKLNLFEECRCYYKKK